MDYKRGYIDLHLHSTVSDGTFSPEEIIDMAERLHLGAIAITDHDAIDGSRAALQYGIPPSLKFLTGVEISAEPPLSCNITGSMHILGYSIRLEDPGLTRVLGKLQDARKNRNPQILERLNTMGVDISLNEVISLAGTKGQTGRPHIAQVLLLKGVVKSIQEAFDRYIGKGKPAYVDKYRVNFAQAIKVIKDAGGVAVLAHPYIIYPEHDHRLEKLVILLAEKGLGGIEVFYPNHTPDNTRYFIEIARRHNLLMTGGTDFHGDLTPQIKMGTGRGNFSVPYSLYADLVEKVSGCAGSYYPK